MVGEAIQLCSGDFSALLKRTRSNEGQMEEVSEFSQFRGVLVIGKADLSVTENNGGPSVFVRNPNRLLHTKISLF